MGTFSKVLARHFENEFEVQIRGGKITEAGEEVLNKLTQDYDILQYKCHIGKMIRHQKKRYRRVFESNPSYMYDLLDVVHEDLVHEVELFIFKTHKIVLKNRRIKTNKMCQEKSLTGPSIFNFTSHKIDSKLLAHLKTGLKNVPVVKIDETKVVEELEEEAVLACKAMFRSQYGYYPRVTSKRLDNAIIGIISQCGSNSELVGQLADFRQAFVDNLPIFILSIGQNGLDVKQIIALIPDRCIITNSDKNVGISILPPEWYKKEYLSQISKGGHELVDLTEEECLARLSNKIREFKVGCSLVQRKLLDSLWPKKVVKHRLGVMKLVPKVKFKNNFLSKLFSIRFISCRVQSLQSLGSLYPVVQ
jgi:hypothetical protein